MLIKVWYCIINDGAGAAYPEFFSTKEAADKKEKEEIDEGYGWGDGVVGHTIIEVEDYEIVS